MKYRIVQDTETNKFRAEIGKENRFGGIDWSGIENDNNELCYRVYQYDTIEDAEIAITEHHSKKYANKGVKVVKNIELD